MSMQRYPEDKTIAGRTKEIEIKVARIQEFLEKEGLNALYLTLAPNFAWITAGGDGVITICMEGSCAAALITKEGKRYIITNEIEDRRMREEQQLEELGFEVVSQNWFDNKNAEYIEKFAGDLAKVGSDTHFGKCRMIGAHIKNLHASLTHNEICRYQYLGDTMSTALEAYLATTKPGMTEFDIVAGVSNALWPHEIGQVLFLVASDERVYNHRHPIPTMKKSDKLLMVSCNGRYKGLITTTTRMVYYGNPTQEFLTQFDKTCEIECRMIAATKAGVDEIVPHRIGKASYEEFGQGPMYYKHAQGGPQSYYNRYYSVSETMHEITVENQCYCYQPVIDGTKTEDAFIVMSDGPLMVTKPMSFPKITKTIDGVTMERPGILVID
ncbi:MAG: M24 family metallopeptidase [Oscillospiraceae bacterium]|nr:M24 family metallopeptidase [Oscillospiraceae bacterium]MCL2277808.1 M24 family metallopeptidase [Oscillospiraceae bacterium]